MPEATAIVSTGNPDEGSLELTEDIIRVRAYRFYQERGCEHGHDLEDWLRAEAEIFGKKPSAPAETESRQPGSAAAA